MYNVTTKTESTENVLKPKTICLRIPVSVIQRLDDFRDARRPYQTRTAVILRGINLVLAKEAQ